MPCFRAGMIEGIFATEKYVTARKLLDAAALRHKALAGNMANLETPGYKRIDVSPAFETQLAALLNRGDLKGISSLEPTLVVDPSAGAVGPDGNNVELDHELLNVNRNALEYQVLTEFVSSSLKHLKTAISGRVT